jgi:hypothetical protein
VEKDIVDHGTRDAACLCVVRVVTFVLVAHLFVLVYDGPTLVATFGAPYVRYCARVQRWWPRRQQSRRVNRTKIA